MAKQEIHNEDGAGRRYRHSGCVDAGAGAGAAAGSSPRQSTQTRLPRPMQTAGLWKTGSPWRGYEETTGIFDGILGQLNTNIYTNARGEVAHGWK